MFNHIRTLLLNLPPVVAASGFPGEEIVPDTFQSLTLPGYLQTARAALFGTNPDRAMLNYRLRQFLQPEMSAPPGPG